MILFAQQDERMKQDKSHWYVTMIAALYLVLCSISCVRCALLHFRGDAATVPLAVQLLCLGMALSAGAYFVKPRAGHWGMILFTTGTLIAIGTTDPKATGFHLVVLCLLLLPYFRGWLPLNSRSEAGAAPNGGPAAPVGNSKLTDGPSSVSGFVVTSDESHDS